MGRLACSLRAGSQGLSSIQEAMLILSQNPMWGGWKDLEWVEDLQTDRTRAATHQTRIQMSRSPIIAKILRKTTASWMIISHIRVRRLQLCLLYPWTAAS